MRRPRTELARGSSVIAPTRRDLTSGGWEKSPGIATSNVTTRVSERLAERSQAQARLRRQVVTRRLGYVVAVVILAWVVALSPVFALKPDTIEVSGFGTVVDPGEAASILAGYEGTSLVLLHVGQLRQQLLGVHGVRDVAVERVWPAGLVVTLTPREPVAAIPDLTGGFVLVDDEGVSVAWFETTPAHLPVISVPVGPDHVRVLEAVLAVVRELPVSLRNRVEGIRATTEDSVEFTLRDGPRVEWGSAEQSALKAEVLQVLLDSAEASHADVIDVSAPTLPVTRTE